MSLSVTPEYGWDLCYCALLLLTGNILKKNYHYQYSETNVMHFLFNLLRIKGLYMFQALLAHPQEARHQRHLVYVYCVCVMSFGCTRIGVELQSGCSQPLCVLNCVFLT
jgi:hypothetical protein